MKMSGEPEVLITGGAGFIGTNLAARIAAEGRTVAVFDNLSRKGVAANLDWLRRMYGDRVQVIFGDVRNQELVRTAMEPVRTVFHLAAQVAVTTSLVNPILDFEVNARGTLNVLEAAREISRGRNKPVKIVFSSTNKVLGSLKEIALEETLVQYRPVDPKIREFGIGESHGISFCSPYGCSKGAADQYVLDYAHTFGLPGVVFRMSCIYGPHQRGNEDQGWVAHFLLRALSDSGITLYGDGKQVRDILFVDDLVRAFLTAEKELDREDNRIAGQAFNLGGGPSNAISLLELIRVIEDLNGVRLRLQYKGWRQADQRYFVSDTRKFRDATGWEPQTSAWSGVRKLYDWFRQQGPQSESGTGLPREGERKLPEAV